MQTNLMNQFIHEEKKVLISILQSKEDIIGDSVQAYTNNDIENIYVIGSGTSYHAALVAKDTISKLLNKQVFVMYPTHFEREHLHIGGKQLVIGISQGGRSLSTIHGIEKAKQLGFPTIGISEYADSDLADTVDYFIPLSIGSVEKAGAKTKGYVGTILTLILFAMQASGQQDEELMHRLQTTFRNLDTLAQVSEEWYQKIKEDFYHAKDIAVIGYGANYATALEGALKLLETARVPVVGYEMEEYMHGVYNCISPDSFIIFLASEHKDKERLLNMKEFLGNITDHCYVIGKEGTFETSDKDLAFAFQEQEDFSAFEYIVPVQILSSLLSADKGIDAAIPKFPNFHTMMGSKVANV